MIHVDMMVCSNNFSVKKLLLELVLPDQTGGVTVNKISGTHGEELQMKQIISGFGMITALNSKGHEEGVG